jgi:hypothetical protein
MRYQQFMLRFTLQIRMTANQKAGSSNLLRARHKPQQNSDCRHLWHRWGGSVLPAFYLFTIQLLSSKVGVDLVLNARTSGFLACFFHLDCQDAANTCGDEQDQRR